MNMKIVNYFCKDCGAFLYARDEDCQRYFDHFQKNQPGMSSGRCANCWSKLGKFWVICWAPGYDIEIVRAFHPQEGLSEYALWFQFLVLHGAGEHLRLPYLRSFDLPKTHSDGSFPGCYNHAWIISAEDKARYICLNKERKKNQEF